MSIFGYNPTVGWRKWGLLRRTSKVDSCWVPVKTGRFIFDTEREALQQANNWNTEQGHYYLYKVVPLKITIVEE